MKTIAVGPRELIEFCVTGGATVAILDRCSPFLVAHEGIDRVSKSLEALCPRFVTSLRDAMMNGDGSVLSHRLFLHQCIKTLAGEDISSI